MARASCWPGPSCRGCVGPRLTDTACGPGCQETQRTASEKQACIKNLKMIYDAIQAFKPTATTYRIGFRTWCREYLADANVLICPVCRRTGESEGSSLSDPKLPSSYLYEFSPVPLGQAGYERSQPHPPGMEAPPDGPCGRPGPAGPVPPSPASVESFLRGQGLREPAVWEMLFTNRVSAADLTPARLFADEPPRAAKAPKKAGGSATRPAGAQADKKD